MEELTKLIDNALSDILPSIKIEITEIYNSPSKNDLRKLKAITKNAIYGMVRGISEFTQIPYSVKNYRKLIKIQVRSAINRDNFEIIKTIKMRNK